MATSKLGTDYSKAFSRLCHLAALTRTGKTAAAIDGLIVSTWSIDPGSCGSISALGDAVSGYFGLRLPEPTLQLSLDRLVSAGRLIARNANEWYDLSIAEQEAFDERTRSAKEIQQSVKATWLSETSADPALVSVPPNDLWNCLETYTAAAFQRHGIHAIELLSGSHVSDGDGSLQSFLSSAISVTGLSGQASAVTAAIRRFFAEATPEKTRYLAGLLDATFTYFAIAVDDITSKYLRDSLKPLKIFVDTNVLFGVLELSEDYFAGIARQLLAMIREGKLPFTLYFHERTIREFRDTIDAAAADVCQQRWTPELSRAAVRYGEETGALGSVELAYHRQNALVRTPPEVFFSKFDYLDRLLTDQGFRVYRDPQSDDSDATQLKGMRIAEYEAFVKSERPDRPRRYEARDHDVVLWETVLRLRTTRAAPLESGAIFLTNDYLFARFARQRLQASGDSSAVVMAPQFVQVLRPFVPSSDDFDRGFVQNLTLPEFQVVHRDYREAGEHVLGYLATYSGLSEETALAVLSDEILRHQAHDAGPEISMETLIDSAIIRDNGKLRDANEALRSDLREVESKSSEAINRLESRLAALESSPAPALVYPDRTVDTAVKEREQALSDLRSLRRSLKWTAFSATVLAYLMIIWVGPILASGFPGLHELASHSHRLAIQLIASAASPLAFIAIVDKERRIIWLATLAVADPLVIAIAAVL